MAFLNFQDSSQMTKQVINHEVTVDDATEDTDHDDAIEDTNDNQSDKVYSSVWLSHPLYHLHI